MKTSREIYYAKMNRPLWSSVVCAFLGHDIYTTRGWYFYERGCHRCGLCFLHQWDLLDGPPHAAGGGA